MGWRHSQPGSVDGHGGHGINQLVSMCHLILIHACVDTVRETVDTQVGLPLSTTNASLSLEIFTLRFTCAALAESVHVTGQFVVFEPAHLSTSTSGPSRKRDSSQQLIISPTLCVAQTRTTYITS